MAVTDELAAAYSCTGAAWERGPARVYRRLAKALLDDCPGGVAGRRVLDLGAGTGTLAREARARRAADVVAVDVAPGMLHGIPDGVAVAVVGDARRLPFATGSFTLVGAAFSLNHLDDPATALVEARRVLAADGAMVVSAYADDDDHPAKAAVDEAARAHGWRPDHWYDTMRRSSVPHLATEAGALAAARAAGLEGAVARRRPVTIAGLSRHDLVAWRLGLVQLAPWVRGLDDGQRTALVGDALERLGADPPVLIRSMVTLVWSGRSG